MFLILLLASANGFTFPTYLSSCRHVQSQHINRSFGYTDENGTPAFILGQGSKAYMVKIKTTWDIHTGFYGGLSGYPKDYADIIATEFQNTYNVLLLNNIVDWNVALALVDQYGYTWYRKTRAPYAICTDCEINQNGASLLQSNSFPVHIDTRSLLSNNDSTLLRGDLRNDASRVGNVIKLQSSQNSWTYKVSSKEPDKESRRESFVDVRGGRAQMNGPHLVHSHAEYAGEIVLYCLSNVDFCFGYQFIGGYSFPKVLYSNRSDVSIISSLGTFEPHFRRHVSDRKQMLIFANFVWQRCPAEQHCFSLLQDALLTSSGRVDLFSGMFVLRSNSITDAQFRSNQKWMEIAAAYGGLTSGINGAFKDNNNFTYLFKDNMFYEYANIGQSNATSSTRTGNIGSLFTEVTSVSAALFLDGQPSSVYIFSQGSVYRFEWTSGSSLHRARETKPYRDISEELPPDIDSAGTHGDLVVLFKDQFYLTVPRVAFFTLRAQGQFMPVWNSAYFGCNTSDLPSFISREFADSYSSIVAPSSWTTPVPILTVSLTRSGPGNPGHSPSVTVTESEDTEIHPVLYVVAILVVLCFLLLAVFTGLFVRGVI